MRNLLGLIVIFALACSGELIMGTGSGPGSGGGGGGGGGGDGDGDGSGGGGGPGGTPTYHRDVRAILEEKCTHCHVGDGPAFALDSFAMAAAAAPEVVAATTARVMPPWPPDPECSTFEGQARRSLSDAQIETLRRWAEAGSPEGNPADAPPPPPPLPALGEPDLVLDAGGDYMFDNAREDLYWCFRLPGSFAGGLDVTGVQIEPGNRALVHHVIVFREPNGASKARGLPGFECSGVPPNSDFFFGWAPGAEPGRFPDGMAMRLEPTDALVMQIHYHRNTTVSPLDRTRLTLHTADGPVSKRVRVVWTGSIDINVPPGGESTSSGDCTIPAGAGPIEVVATAPHMHQVAVGFRSVVNRGGEEICLVDIPRWDFEWQGGYRFSSPIQLQPGDVIQSSCRFKNDGSAAVGFGEGSADEMCFQFLFVVDPQNALPEKCFEPCTYLDCDALGF